MYKLSLGIGVSGMKEIFNPFQSVAPKIQQHRIILSESIIEYYEKSIVYSDALQTYLDDIMISEETSVSFRDDPTLDAQHNMVNFVSRVPMKCLIADKTEFSGCDVRRVNCILPKQICSNDNNVVNRYSLPIANHLVKAGDNCERYATWLGHWFENEQSITFVDKYLFMGNGEASFKKYIIPYISKNTTINIYCDCNLDESEYASEADLLKAITSYYSDWDIHIFLCSSKSMHDRFIMLSSGVLITIGKGVSFLNASGKIDKDCYISFSECETPSLPAVCSQLC